MADKPSLPPQYVGVQPLRPMRAPTMIERPKTNGTLKVVLAILGATGVSGGGGAITHHYSERETRDMAVETHAQLAEHVKQSDERHAEVKKALGELEDAHRRAMEQRARDTDAILDALRVPKDKRPR